MFDSGSSPNDNQIKKKELSNYVALKFVESLVEVCKTDLLSFTRNKRETVKFISKIIRQLKPEYTSSFAVLCLNREKVRLIL